MSKPKKAFTLIELLVVIAIIGVLATISIIALSNARAKSRDAKRAGDMKQIQTALELFFNDNNRYPTPEEFALGSIFSTSTYGTSTYMQIIPSAPTPVDGNCNSGQNTFSYNQTEDGNSYTISFCLGNTTGTLTAGPKCLTPAGIMDVDCSGGGTQNVVKFGLTIAVSSEQYGNALDQTSDGGYILIGQDNSSGAPDAYVVKTDAYGAVTWSHSIGGVGYQNAKSGEQTSDGGYILAGRKLESDKAYLIKLDVNGDTTWTKELGGIYTQYMANSVEQTSDGGYILAGVYFDSGYLGFLIKTDAAGNLSWLKSFPLQATSVQQTADGGYVITGYSSLNDGDIYLVKTDSAGDLVWSQGIGGSGYQYGSSVRQVADGGYIIAGNNNSVDANGDGYLVKTDSSGNVLWSQIIGGALYQSIESVRQTVDGGYILAGEDDSVDLNCNAYLVKTDSSGNVSWSKSIGDSSCQYAHDVQQTTDGGYVIIADSDSNDGGDIYLIKTDSAGNIE